MKKTKVLGWTDYSSHAFLGEDPSYCIGLPVAEDEEALVECLRERGYLFTGEDMQESDDCCPVMTNYRIARFSRRQFGALMAKALGDEDSMAYSKYTWRFESDKIRKPESGVEAGFDRYRLEVDLEKSVFDYYRANMPSAFDEAILYPIVMPDYEEEGVLWAGQEVYMFHSGSTVVSYIAGIYSFPSRKAMLVELPELNDRSFCELSYDESIISSLVPDDKPILLLALIKEDEYDEN